MASDLGILSAERARLLAELASVDADLRVAAVQAVAAGESVASVARACGVTRPTVYAWVKADPGPVMRARLEELDARWVALVDAVVARDAPAPEIARTGRELSGLQAEAFRRNRQVNKRRRKGLDALPSPTSELRRLAETKLLSLVADKAGEDPTFAAIRDELDEAWRLRQTLGGPEIPF